MDLNCKTSSNQIFLSVSELYLKGYGEIISKIHYQKEIKISLSNRNVSVTQGFRKCVT